jgi:hypothetical protein
MAGLTVTYDQGEGVYSLQALKNRNFGIITGTITFDDSYPTGGESLDLSTKMADLNVVFIEPTGGYVFTYDHSNKKVMAYYADYDAAGDGAMIEYANAGNALDNLGAIPFIAFGYV